MADVQRLITTEDIQRRYNLQNLESNTKIIKTLDKQLTNTFGIIKEYIKYTTALNSAEQYFYDGTPTLENLPASEWGNMEDHLNTLYYDSNAGKVYIFKYNEEDNYFYWEELNDSSLLNVMSTANSQADVSQDNLRRVFNEQPTVPYNVGDIWINGSKIYRCLRNETSESQFYQEDWIDYTQYNDDIASSNALRILGAFKETVETEYATKSLLETTANSITAEVRTVETIANSKNTVFTEEPTPPYYRGDSYIKEVTDSETGITMNLIYVCQYSRTEGTYHAEDFALQPGYATLSQIKVTNDAVAINTGKVTEHTTQISTLRTDVNRIEAEISEIADITTSSSSEDAIIYALELQNIAESEPIMVNVHPIINNISFLYPATGIYPSSTLYPKIRKLKFTNTSTNDVFYYEFQNDLLYYDSEHFDEFILDYEQNICEIIKRCKYNSDGSVGLLDNETVIPYEYPQIDLTEGNYQVEIEGYTKGYIFVRLMCVNAYSAQYATKVELRSAINVEADRIDLIVSRKVGDNEVISKINQTPEQITIDASKINIAGTITAINNNTTTTINGNKITTGTIDASKITAGTITVDKIEARTITADKIAVGTLTANEIKDSTIVNSKIANGTIEGSKIKSATITNSNIANGTITNAQIADGTIVNAKIANGSITGSKIASATITGSNIQNGTITNTQIAGGTITNAQIADGTITGAKIAGGTIDGAKITNSTITSGKMSISNLASISANLGAITAGSININGYFSVNSSGGTQLSTSGGGFLSTRVSTHPYVSALNVAHGSGGIRFTTGTSQSSSGSQVASVYMDNSVLYLRGNNGINIGGLRIYDNYLHAGNIAVGGNYVNADSGKLNLNSGSGVYANGVKIGGSSDEKTKKNIKLITTSTLNDIIKEIKELPVKTYDYNEAYGGEKNNIGFVIQDFKENGILYNLLHIHEFNGIKYYSREDLSQINTVLIKYLLNRIEELEERYG